MYGTGIMYYRSWVKGHGASRRIVGFLWITSFCTIVHCREANQGGPGAVQSALPIPGGMSVGLWPNWCSRYLTHDVQCPWRELCTGEPCDLRRHSCLLCVFESFVEQFASAVGLAAHLVS